MESAKILANEQVGPGVFLLRLEAGSIARAAQPGRFVMLRVSGTLEPLLARPFSIHGVDGDQVLVLSQVVGKGTKMLSRAVVGERLLCWGPLGAGFDLKLKRPLLVAGGMGIAPLAYAAGALAAGGEVAFLVGLAGGDTSMLSILQEPLEPQGVSFSIATEDGSLGVKGLVTALLPDALKQCDGVLACGPLPMLKAVADECAKAGVACQVSLEAPMACGVGACLGCVLPAAGGGYVRVCQEGPVLSAQAVDWANV